jgi:magnesium-transporting ATPase (P-type)
MKNFFNYENLAVQVLTIGATIYAVIILMFLMLYPGSYSKSVRTMESLGVSYPKRVCFIVTASMSIITLSTVFGSFLGTLLWRFAVSALKTSAGAVTKLFIEPGTLGAIVIAQFVFMLLLDVLVSLYVATPKKMSARR